MRAIAVPYCNAIPQHYELYSALMGGLVENIRSVMQVAIILITDDEQPAAWGRMHVLRVPKQGPLMVWRLKAHQMAHTLADEILFVEPDVRLSENVFDVFEDQDFDVALTTRICRAKFNGVEFTERAPYTLGCSFSRNGEFWRQAKIHCESLPEDERKWMGDMFSVAAVAKSGVFKVKELDGRVYNRVPNDPQDTDGAKTLHYGGKRKDWLFPRAQEAA